MSRPLETSITLEIASPLPLEAVGGKKNPKSEEQDSETHPLPRPLPNLNGYFLNLSFTLPKPETQGARKPTGSKSWEGRDICNFYPSLSGPDFTLHSAPSWRTGFCSFCGSCFFLLHTPVTFKIDPRQRVWKGRMFSCLLWGRQEKSDG